MKRLNFLPSVSLCAGLALCGVALVARAQQGAPPLMPAEQMGTSQSMPAYGSNGYNRWIPNNSEEGGYEMIDRSNEQTRAQVVQEFQRARADQTWITRQGEETGYWPAPVAMRQTAHYQ